MNTNIVELPLVESDYDDCATVCFDKSKSKVVLVETKCQDSKDGSCFVYVDGEQYIVSLPYSEAKRILFD